MMCFVPQKRFRRNKVAIEQSPDGWSYEHLPVSLPHIGVFRPPRWTILIDHVTQILLTTLAGRNNLAK